MFYEGHKGIHKTFWGTTKKCEKKIFKFIFYFSINFLNPHDGKG